MPEGRHGVDEPEHADADFRRWTWKDARKTGQWRVHVL